MSENGCFQYNFWRSFYAFPELINMVKNRQTSDFHWVIRLAGTEGRRLLDTYGGCYSYVIIDIW